VPPPRMKISLKERVCMWRISSYCYVEHGRTSSSCEQAR
jgi:hypothetical protein